MTWRGIVRLAGVSGVIAAAVACAKTQSGAADSQAPGTAVAPGGVGEWRALFDGRTLTGWRVYNSQNQPPGWAALDGVLTKRDPTDDIITAETFGDFELEWEWRIARGGNAGVMYRATEEYERAWRSAPEYQLLDDAANATIDRRNAAGAAYDLYPAPAGHVKPAGEWNASRLVVRGAHVEHWLNGTKLLEYELGSADWTARVKASKFNEWPNFGRARRGHIAIQGDHAGELSLRNIRIRELRG